MNRPELAAMLRTRAAELRATARNMVRLAHDVERHVSDSRSWEEFKAEAKPGCCPCCDTPLPKQTSGRKRVICGDADCKRLFQAVYDQRRTRRDS